LLGVGMEIAILNLVLGVVVLLLGRKLFWLFVGVAGFLMGMDIAERFFSGPHTTKLLIALAIGIAGAFLAVLFYKAAVAISGFLVGGYLAIHFMQYLQISVPRSGAWLPYVVGGILGAILILLLLDWALIILSSFAGASMILQSVTQRQFNTPLVFMVLVTIGIWVQARMLLRSRSKPATD
jgi:hypothetical protein